MLGGVVQRISYSAYGRPTFFDAAGHTRTRPTFGPAGTHHSMAIGWQDLFYDLETGNSYNRARMLSHRLGRFLQRDPLGYVDGMSLYEYLGSNSLDMLDPLGLEVGFIEGIGNYILVGQRETGVPPGELWGAAGEGALEGAQGGASIAGNTLTFGATDKLGITNSEQYEGEVYARSRVAATVARESLLAAGGGGLGRLATNGSRVFGALARGANTVQRARNAYDNAEEVYDVVVDVKEAIEYLGSDDPCATDGGATRRLLQTVAERLVQRAVHSHASRPSVQANANAGVVAPSRGGPYGHLDDHASAGSGKNFTQAQKQKILAENQARNGGVLRDDRTGEALARPQQSQRDVTPPGNEAQVDHVYPRSEGGPNTYSNAEVRSRANNIRKSNNIED